LSSSDFSSISINGSQGVAPMLNWLSKFNLRKWWHPAIALGLALAVAALAIKDHDLAAIGLGMVFCGFGEQMLEAYSRFNRPIGFALVGLGVIFIALGLYRLLGL
jgi:hypothetical protein